MILIFLGAVLMPSSESGWSFVAASTPILNWERTVRRLLDLRWLQRVFWCVGQQLQKYPARLRDRVADKL